MPLSQTTRLQPDCKAVGFSLQTAYFLSEMSNVVYKERPEVERVVKDQLGYSHFSWFEVSVARRTSVLSLFACSKKTFPICSTLECQCEYDDEDSTGGSRKSLTRGHIPLLFLGFFQNSLLS